MENANNNTVSTFTKTIWVSKKDEFEKKVKHLNKILAKYGKPQLTYSHG